MKHFVKNKRAGWYLWMAVMICCLAAVHPDTAFAVAKRVYSLQWDSGEGKAIISWETTPEKEICRVRLYKGNIDNPVSKWISTKSGEYDFSYYVSRNGTGYYFTEVQIKNGGDGTKYVSELLAVDDSLMEAVKERLKKLAETASDPNAGRTGWIGSDEFVWVYRYADGTYAAGWKEIDGKTYYFSKSGQMLTGWQGIDGHWYYFTKSGECVRNGTSPEGYQLNEDGCWVINGVVQDGPVKPGKTKKKSEDILDNLKLVKINSSEKKTEPNTVRPMSVTCDKTCTVGSYSFSKPYEKWKPGEKINVTVQLLANDGYVFTDFTSIEFDRGKLVSSAGTSIERTIVYEYYPRTVLPAPQYVRIEEDILRWKKPENATRIKLEVMVNGELERSEILTDNYSDLSGLPGGTLEIRMISLSSESTRNFYYDSAALVVKDAETIRISGRLIFDENNLYYEDESGNRAKNQWVKLAGHWYHFRQTGAAEPMGWYQEGGHSYYFDGEHRMMTGSVTVDGQTYTLNAGERDDIPLGARY